MIQTLSENNIPPTQIAQLSGHRNLKSIQNYSTVSTKQQMHMSKVLSSVVAGTPASSSSETACPSSSDSQNTGKQSMALLSGAVIQGGNWGLMKTPLLSSAGFVCLRVGYREVFWEEFSRLT